MRTQFFSNGLLPSVAENVIENYLSSVEKQDSMNLYREIIDTVEFPLLKVVMKHFHGDQARAALCLGINRATLRSKLKRHRLI